MFNPDKDLARIILECLGSEGLSISSLDKKLKDMDIDDHRLILTGYLRAMTDLGMLRMRDVPPSKIYLPAKKAPESIYQAVQRLSRQHNGIDTDELILYTLYKLFKRPIFVSELKDAGVFRPIGKPASDENIEEVRKLLRKAGNVLPNEDAFIPANDYPTQLTDILCSLALEKYDVGHLVQQTKQTTLL